MVLLFIHKFSIFDRIYFIAYSINNLEVIQSYNRTLNILIQLTVFRSQYFSFLIIVNICFKLTRLIGNFRPCNFMTIKRNQLIMFMFWTHLLTNFLKNIKLIPIGYIFNVNSFMRLINFIFLQKITYPFLRLFII